MHSAVGFCDSSFAIMVSKAPSGPSGSQELRAHHTERGLGFRVESFGLRVEGDSGQTNERLPCNCRSPESQPPGAVLCRRHRWPERGLGVGVEGSGLGLDWA